MPPDVRATRAQPLAIFADALAVAITGPYRFLKTAGPARLGVTDLGLTFASNGRRGVLISFHRRVPGIERLGLVRDGELTVTVNKPEALVELLRAECGLRRCGAHTPSESSSNQCWRQVGDKHES